MKIGERNWRSMLDILIQEEILSNDYDIALFQVLFSV